MHLLKPARLRNTHELLQGYGVFDGRGGAPVAPRRAEEEEVLWFHTQPYIDAVRRVGISDESAARQGFNLGMPDNPAYIGMYNAALWSMGASPRAVALLPAEEVDLAFSISGGLHHAMPGFASGFCVFNDPVIAIIAMLRRCPRPSRGPLYSWTSSPTSGSKKPFIRCFTPNPPRDGLGDSP